MATPAATLKKLGLSESEITVYIALTATGALTVRELIKQTGLKRPTTYYALRQLESQGLAHKTGHQGVERFQAEDPKHLVTLLEIRKQELSALETEIESIIPELTVGVQAPEAIPGVSFYEGEIAMKQVIMDTLYCRRKHIDSIAPSDNFFWQVGQDFSGAYIKERVARGITTRNLWEKPLKPDIMTKTYKGRSEVRILPTVMHGRFKSTVFLYDNCVMYVSSKRTGYVLVVKSQEHYDTMQALYDGLWESSTKISTARGI